MPSNDNYIIAFDEQGKPYIAHSMLGNMRSRLFQSRMANGRVQQRSPRQNHKYILRIDDNGRKRYFYTREEIQAYYKSKRGKTASDTEKNQNGTSLQDTAKNAVSLAKTQISRMHEDYKKLIDDNKTDTKSSTSKSSTQSSTQSSSKSSTHFPKPYTGVADYARQKALEANTPKTTYTPPEEDDTSSKKSSKKSSSSTSSSGSSNSRSSSGSSGSRSNSNSIAPQSMISQMPSTRYQQFLNTHNASDSNNNNDDEYDDTIAKAAKNLEGADKYDAYKKAVEDYKSNPSKENAEKRDKLKQEWLETPHGKFVPSVSSELKSKKQDTEQKKSLNNIYANTSANRNYSLIDTLNNLNWR